MKDQLKEWWDGLAPRERIYLGAGAFAVIVMLAYTMIWAPLSSNVSSLRASVAKQHEDLQWMRQAAPKLEQLQRSSPGNAGAGRSMLAVVDRNITEAGLKGALQRMEPDGRNGVKIWLSGGAFDSLITMLGELEQNNGIQASSLSITATQAPGRVDARATLTRSG